MPTALWILLGSGIVTLSLHAQVVPTQANIDASAQRRLQEDARESLRRRRMEESVRALVPALDSARLAGPEGSALTRQAIAAFADLQDLQILPKDAVKLALKKSSLDPSQTRQTSTYLLDCWDQMEGKLTSDDLTLLRQGLAPKTSVHWSPFSP